MINPDFRDLFCAFNARDVRFLVVGAYAVTFHARPRFTKDLDVWVDPKEDNARRVWQALAEFGAPLTGVAEADFTRPGVVLQIGVVPNRIDVLTSITGVAFRDAWGRRVSSEYGDQAIHVLSREDLIVNKKALGRPSDLADVAELER